MWPKLPEGKKPVSEKPTYEAYSEFHGIEMLEDLFGLLETFQEFLCFPK